MASKRKHVPAQRYLTYNLGVATSDLTASPPTNITETYYLDLARDLSLLNRRLYRQGMDYHVKSITVMSRNTPTGSITASVVPCTWTIQNAYRRGFKAWRKSIKDALTNVGDDIKGKWADFRIQPIYGILSGAYPLPVDADGNQYPAGTFDWDQAQFHHPADDANGANIHLLGDHVRAADNYASVGLVKSYFESRVRTRPEDPILDGDVSDDYINTLYDYDETIGRRIQTVEQHGDNPPYDHDNCVGEAIMPAFHNIKTQSMTDGNARIGPFKAFMGQVRIDLHSDAQGLAADVMKIVVELAPGQYKGIKAEACV